MLTKREEGQLYAAMQAGLHGQKILVYCGQPKKRDEYFRAVFSLGGDSIVARITDNEIKFPASGGSIRFEHAPARLKGLEYDVAFFNETEPVPEEVLARVRGGVK